MSELREAAQAVLNDYDGDGTVEDTEQAIDRLRAALAQPETAEPVIGPEWTPCVKLPITVHVREQRPGEQHVSTREGITPVKPDDLIMRGVAGEEYPIGRELFAKTYRIGDKLPPDDAEPVAWLNRYHAAMVTQDHATAVAMGFTTPLYTRPPCDRWREVVHEHLITCHIFSKENSVDPRQALSDLIAWHCKIALDPAVSIEAQELFDRGRHSVDPTLE